MRIDNEEIAVVSDKRKKVGGKYSAELTLKTRRLNMTVVLWGGTPEELELKVADFLKPQADPF